jgi:acrylyl-CoA reductase (NADPH)
MAPKAERVQAWSRLASDLDANKLDAMTTEIPLAQTIAQAAEILAGNVRGRIVVNVNA